MEIIDLMKMKEYLSSAYSAAEEAVNTHILSNRNHYSQEVVKACAEGCSIEVSPEDDNPDTTYNVRLVGKENVYQADIPDDVIRAHVPDYNLISDIQELYQYYEAMVLGIATGLLVAPHQNDQTVNMMWKNMFARKDADGNLLYSGIEIKTLTEDGASVIFTTKPVWRGGASEATSFHFVIPAEKFYKPDFPMDDHIHAVLDNF